MPKFYVSVKADFVLYKVIEAESEEEVVEVLESLRPEDFDNFNDIYEWLGEAWNQLIKDVKVDRI